MAEKDKKMHPMLDWLFSVIVIVLGLFGISYVLFNEGAADELAKDIFTLKGLAVAVVVYAILSSIRAGIRRKKLVQLRQELKDKMEEDWERKDV